MSAQSVAEQFWAESHRKRERDEEIAAMLSSTERVAAMIADVWTGQLIDQELSQQSSIFFRPPHELDTWLAEDGPMPHVEAALR